MKYFGNPSVAFTQKIPHTPDSLSERVNRIMGFLQREKMPDDMPTQVELYFLRFKNATFSWDMTDVVDEVWSNECRLTFDEKLEFIYKLVTWDEFKFDVDCSDIAYFSALKYAVRITSYKENSESFLIKHINSMNYPSKLSAAKVLGRHDEAKECLEHLMNNSTEWQIIQRARMSLWSICKRSYPDELYKVDFDVADIADPKTKPDLERMGNVRFIPVDELENDD